MKRARFVTPARREVLAEVTYYNAKELGLGSRFLASVEDATSRALAYPLTGTPATKNTRRMFLKDFPFALVYRPDEEGIVVFALAHHAKGRSPRVLAEPHGLPLTMPFTSAAT